MLGVGVILPPIVFMAITGPIALYNNVPIEPQYFAPWRFVIGGVILGVTTTFKLVIPPVTTLNYVVGQQVRVIIPPTFGCRQLNERVGYVLSITLPNKVEVSIDSSIGIDPYIGSSATTPAQMLAIGDINSGQINSNGVNTPLVTVPGAFINVSPN